MTITREERDYLLNILKHQLNDIKKFEKSPDPQFSTFADEVKIDAFLENLIEKVKKL